MAMNSNPLMVIIPTNVFRIQLLKYYDNDDRVIHIQQLTKVYLINGEDIYDHKLQYFLNSLKRELPISLPGMRRLIK
jgi:hypothetical protein